MFDSSVSTLASWFDASAPKVLSPDVRSPIFKSEPSAELDSSIPVWATVDVLAAFPVTSLDAASASSGVPPEAITSLNLLNAVLSFEAAFIALLSACDALISAEGSPVLVNRSKACVMRKADAASLASLLPVNEAAASASPAKSLLANALAALAMVKPVRTSAGKLAPA